MDIEVSYNDNKPDGTKNSFAMAATLQDVADAARVSLATVSKVLNNRYDVAPETAELVQGVIRQVGYQRAATRRGRPASSSPRHPLSGQARLRSSTGATATGIALFIPANQAGPMQSALTGQLVHGAEAVAQQHGLHFHLTRFSDDGALPPCLDPVQVDGMIIRNTRADWGTPLPQIPTVWVFKLGYAPVPGDLVQPDNEMVGQMAANYLLGRGHKHLAALTGRTDHAEAQVRADRFVRFCRAAGATALALEGGDMGVLVDELLAQSPRITGLFLPLGDNVQERLYRALQRRKVRCGADGADIDLISCNNDATYLRLVDPSLPNIDIRASEIGRAAAQTLLWRIQNPAEHRRCILIEPKMVLPGPPSD